MFDAASFNNLPPRKPSLLVRYPRNVKLAATVALLAVIVLPPAVVHGLVKQPAVIAPHSPQPLTDAHDPAVGMPLSAPSRPVTLSAQAPSLNEPDDLSVRLTPAPDPRITEDTAQGSLPRIGEDGSYPWRVYARPFNTADARPRIAVILDGLGPSRLVSDQAVSRLPGVITLSFDARSPVVGAWVNRARQDGHEVLLQVPSEPYDFPRSDPGPTALLTSLSNSDNLARLQGLMRRASGYIGVISPSGSRFTSDAPKLSPMLQELATRGLMVVDARAAPHSAITNVARSVGLPVVTVTQKLDRDLSPESITSALSDLEKTASLTGSAIGLATATPVMIEQLQLWAKDLPQRGFALAPVSVMVK